MLIPGLAPSVLSVLSMNDPDCVKGSRVEGNLSVYVFVSKSIPINYVKV